MVGQFLGAVGLLVLPLPPTPSAAQLLSWRNHPDLGRQSALGHQSDYPLPPNLRRNRCVLCSAGSDTPRRLSDIRRESRKYVRATFPGDES
jgi:hypothetical protein